MARAKVVVDGGICGFTTTVLASESEDGMIGLVVESECPNVKALAASLSTVDPMGLLMSRAKDGEVYAAAARCLPHQACPVPTGILKAVEVAGGLALAKDVSIKVEKEE